MNFINEIEHNNEKFFLRKELDEYLNLEENKKIKLSIKKELELKVPLFKKNKEFYRNLIFYSKSENVVDELDLEIIFCNNNTELIDIWKYFKVMSSSATTSDDGFGYLKMMLKDKMKTLNPEIEKMTDQQVQELRNKGTYVVNDFELTLEDILILPKISAQFSKFEADFDENVTRPRKNFINITSFHFFF
jgi:hypothetical protein